MTVFKCILRSFELVSGLKVNIHKSKLVGASVESNQIGSFSGLVNCRTMTVPLQYLGLPVGGNPRRLSLWDPVVSRLQKKLSSWRRNSLSFGGGIYLLKSILESIPLYFLSMFRMPLGILKKCKSRMREFLWGGKEGENKVAWVSWDFICKPKAIGGLGLREWGKFNKPLLGEWRWRLLTDRDSLVCRVLTTKYKGRVPISASVLWRSE